MKPTLAAQNFGHARHGHGSHLADFAMCGTHLEMLTLPGLLLSDMHFATKMFTKTERGQIIDLHYKLLFNPFG